MLKIGLDDSKIFKETLSIINELISEGVFSFTNEGMKLISMDSTSVSMVIFHLLPTAFSSYELKQDFKVGLSIDQIRNVLKRLTGNEKVMIEITEDSFIIEIFGTHKKTFRLPILDLDKEPLKVPPLEFTSEVQLSPEILKDVFEDAAVISDSVTLEANANEFLVRSSGGTSHVEIKLDSQNQAIKSFNTKEESKSKYSLDYLTKMIKASKVSNSVKIGFKTDFPLKLEYSSLDKFTLNYILAPMSS